MASRSSAPTTDSHRPVRPRVLLIESGHAWRTRAALWLRAKGHATEYAHSLDEAYLLLKLQPPDVVVVDFDEARGDHLLTLADLMGEQQRAAPILVASPDRQDDVLSALRQGLACDFLDKPLECVQTLLRAVERAWQLSKGQSSGTDLRS